MNSWLALADTLRTASIDFDNEKLRIIKEILARLVFINDVGLGYIELGRAANTLSGGEAQRIRLATQIGSGL